MSKPTTSHQPGRQVNELLKSVAAYMSDHSLVLTTAESCTAGLIAAHLADVPGAGQLLECAFVAYSPEAKRKRLGVKAQTLKDFNLTSEEVAREMATGAMRNSDANLAISNTGVSDDTDPDIEEGTQCFAWYFAGQDDLAEKLFSETRKFDGDRNAIRDQAALHALAQIPVMHARFMRQAAPQAREGQEVAHESS